MATNGAQNIPTAASGKVLQGAGVGSACTFSTPTYPSTSGSSRTILVSDGTNNIYSTETWAVPGSSGNVLTSDGTNWTSAAPSGGGGSLIYIQKQSASSSSTIDFTSVGSYTSWLLKYEGMTPASDGASLRMQISTNGGSSWVSSTYTSGEDSSAYNSATLTNLNSSTNFYCSPLQDSGASTSRTNANIWIVNVASQGTYIYGNGGGSDSSGTTNKFFFGGKTTTSGANAFRMIMSSGNIASGDFILYGIKES